VLCINGCGRRRLFVISKLCEPCHLAENPEDAAPAEREPLRRLYEAKCIMCSRGQSYEWSDDELNAQHGTRFCGHCGGRVLIDHADIGNTGSPMLGHTTGYKSLALMGRKAG
jgi:ribosomal protein S27AE